MGFRLAQTTDSKLKVKSLKEEATVESVVSHTHLQKEGLSIQTFFVWQVTVLEVTANNQPKAAVLNLS